MFSTYPSDMYSNSDKNRAKQHLTKRDYPFFTKNTMRVALQSKQFHRAQKGLPLNGYVTKDYIELCQFLFQLNSDHSTITNGQRFQLILNLAVNPRDAYKKSHWLTLDIQKQDKGFSFVMMDSAFLLSHNLMVLQTMREHCCNARMAYIFMKQQHDTENCGTFAYDYACRLAKIPALHSQVNNMAKSEVLFNYVKSLLKNNSKNMPQCMTDKQIINTIEHTHCLPLQDCPYEFGPLMRNTQSMTMLKNHFWSNQYRGNDACTLAQYVNARVIQSIKEQSKEQNHAIDYKRREMKAKTINYQTEIRQQMRQLYERVDYLMANIKPTVAEHSQLNQLHNEAVLQNTDCEVYNTLKRSHDELKDMVKDGSIIDGNDVMSMANTLQIKIPFLKTVVSQGFVKELKDICNQMQNIACQMGRVGPTMS